MIQIPADLQYKVDEEYWCESFDPENPEHLKEKIINGYITCMLVGYRAGNRKNQRLWQIFHEDFEGFTYDIFKIAHRLLYVTSEKSLSTREYGSKQQKDLLHMREFFKSA